MSAINIRTKRVISTNAAVLLSLTRSNNRRKNSVTIARCIPDTTIRYETPVSENAFLTSYGKAFLSPSSTARDIAEAFLSSEELNTLLIFWRSITA